VPPAAIWGEGGIYEPGRRVSKANRAVMPPGGAHDFDIFLISPAPSAAGTRFRLDDAGAFEEREARVGRPPVRLLRE
jgi:hypothetical protein